MPTAAAFGGLLERLFLGVLFFWIAAIHAIALSHGMVSPPPSYHPQPNFPELNPAFQPKSNPIKSEPRKEIIAINTLALALEPVTTASQKPP